DCVHRQRPGGGATAPRSVGLCHGRHPDKAAWGRRNAGAPRCETSGAAMNSPPQREWQPSARDWIAIFGAILGAFMAVLDIQITNAALKDIQGGIAASLDEGTWISTGYLVAEIVTIPLSVWLAGIFSMKRYLITNCALFLLFSMLCGLSDSLTMMVICRVGQGFTGGVFIPLAMTIVLRCLPPSKQPIGLTLLRATATFAPAFLFLELRHKEPFINLRLLCQPAFASASGMGFDLGLTLYGTVYLLPVYLTQIRCYDALQIGDVIMWLGLPQLFIFPIVPAVMRRAAPVLMVAFGFLMFAVSCFMNSYLTHDWAIQQFRWSQLVRAVGQPFMVVPLSALVAGSQPERNQAHASAIFNIMRNLGGSVGIAMLATYVTVRE